MAGKAKRRFVPWARREDVIKSCSRHSARRTAARASAKVGRALAYHAAVKMRRRSRALRREASSVTMENGASRQGVVRAKSLVRDATAMHRVEELEGGKAAVAE